MLEDKLPGIVPIFPLSGALLLPRGVLPLNIFEPRYLNMIHDTMANDRIIGMVQPLKADDKSDTLEIYRTGCIGRITAFNETGGERFLIMLTGVSRFDCVRELPEQNGYRRVVTDYSNFSEDQMPEAGDQIDRNRLLDVLRLFLQQNSIEVEWKAVTALPDEQLIVSLAMTCPFESNEKQALLECPNLADRSQVLTALLEMALLAPGTGDGIRPN